MGALIAVASNDPTVGYVGIGVLGFAVGAVGLWLQQRNRSGDRTDARLLAQVQNDTGNVQAAFKAWQQVNAALTTQNADQQKQITLVSERLNIMEARTRLCEEETVPGLRAEIHELQEGRLGLLARVSALEPTVDPSGMKRRQGDHPGEPTP